jgi:hypothetical protein
MAKKKNLVSTVCDCCVEKRHHAVLMSGKDFFTSRFSASTQKALASRNLREEGLNAARDANVIGDDNRISPPHHDDDDRGDL